MRSIRAALLSRKKPRSRYLLRCYSLAWLRTGHSLVMRSGKRTAFPVLLPILSSDNWFRPGKFSSGFSLHPGPGEEPSGEKGRLGLLRPLISRVVGRCQWPTSVKLLKHNWMSRVVRIFVLTWSSTDFNQHSCYNCPYGPDTGDWDAARISCSRVDEAVVISGCNWRFHMYTITAWHRTSGNKSALIISPVRKLMVLS